MKLISYYNEIVMYYRIYALGRISGWDKIGQAYSDEGLGKIIDIVNPNQYCTVLVVKHDDVLNADIPGPVIQLEKPIQRKRKKRQY